MRVCVVCVSRPHTHNEPSLHTQVPAHGHAPAACLQLAPGVLLLINQELAKHAVDAPGPLLRVRSVVARDHVAWCEEWFLVLRTEPPLQAPTNQLPRTS